MINRRFPIFQTSNDIFIWIEINHSGQIEPVSLELLTCAKTISAYTNGATCAIVINPDSSVIENIKYYPVDKVFIVNVPIYSFYDSAAQAFIISEICQKYVKKKLTVCIKMLKMVLCKH